MIDTITLKSCIGEYADGDLSRFDQVAFIKNSTIKKKATINYRTSPVTGAQMEILPTVEDVGGREFLYLTIKIAVAAALAGQNLIHNGLEVLPAESALIGKMVRWILNHYGYGRDTIKSFMKNTEMERLELTWHSPTANLAAAKSLQGRIARHCKSLLKNSGRHDIQVHNVQLFESYGASCMLVIFKDGTRFRQYVKAEQAKSRTDDDRSACFLSKEMRPHVASMLTAIEGHVRNEVILGKKMLEAFDLVHPRTWSAASFQRAIEHVMHMARFDQRRIRNMKELDIAGLSDEVVKTARRYFAGDEVANWMSKQSFSKHRKLLLAKHLDIAEALPTSKDKSTARGGMQLSYAKRWVPLPFLSKLAICESRVEAIAALLEPPPPPPRDGKAEVRRAVRAVARPGTVGRPRGSTINTDRSPL